MATPAARSKTFATGDTIDASFLNTWVQDYIIANAANLETHENTSVDPHGASPTVTGTMTAAGFALSSPSKKALLAPAAFINSDSSAFTINASTGRGSYGVSDSSDRSAYAALPSRIQPGHEITAIALRATRTGGTITLELIEKDTQGTPGITTLRTLTINSGTGAVVDNDTGLSITISAAKSYYLKLTLNNAGTANNISLDEVEFTYDHSSL